MATSTLSAADRMAAMFTAVADQDLATLEGFWHEQTMQVLHALDMTIVGREAIGGFFDELFTALQGMDFAPDDIHAVDDRVAVGQWHLVATFAGGPFQGIEPTGREVELRGVDVMRFDEDGRLDRNDIYYDGLTFARQIGLLPAAGSAADRGMTAAFNAMTRTRRSIGERLSG